MTDHDDIHGPDDPGDGDAFAELVREADAALAAERAASAPSPDKKGD